MPAVSLGHWVCVHNCSARPVSKLGRKAIEEILDPAAPPEERAQRRRRLTKGPPEFREDRVICRNGKADPASDGRENVQKAED
jgi:hypothetical protein